MTYTFIDRLKRTRVIARGVLVAGRLWPLALPLLITVALYLTVSWFGLFRIIPDWARISLATAFALVGLASIYPLFRLKLPTPAEVDRHIEHINRLKHTPVTAQSDRLSKTDDPFAQALWQEHKARLAKGIGRLSSGLPKTGVPDRDPWGVRAAVALLLVTAFGWSLGQYGGSVVDPLREHKTEVSVPPRIDAWVTPPAYTGKPPIYLTAGDNRDQVVFKVPVDSAVTLRASGGDGAFALEYAEEGGAASPVDADQAQSNHGAQQFTSVLEENGELTLKDGEAVLSRWQFVIIPDNRPVIEFAGEPKRALNGTLELSYRIQDDYGAASAEAQFSLAEPRKTGARSLYEAPEFRLDLPRRGARSGDLKTSRDLTEHPWAGAEVIVQLSVTDDAGQEGLSEEKQIRLPERTFTNPLAKAVIEQRRILALDANRKSRVLELMDAVMLWPEETFESMAHFLALASAHTRLKMAYTDESLRGVVDYLWDIARGIEDGDLTAAEKRLREAQEALRQALENGASDEEIEQLMAELREAMNEFMRELAEQAMKNPNFSEQMVPPDMQLRQSDLDRLLDQIEELAKSGAREQAQELLSQLQEMMNNMQAMRGDNGQQGGQQGEMRQQMDQLGEIMRRQQELMNETFRMDQMRRGERGQQGQRGREGQPGGEQGQGGMTPEEFAEAMRRLQEGQGQLQGDLGELMEGLRGLGIQPGDGFNDAGRHMGEAGDALGEGDGEQAVGEQGEALEALRRGAQDMMDKMQQAMRGEGGGSEVGGRRNADRDPLGRPRATTGPDFGDSVKVPDEIDVQRAREILEAIRKRLGDALSPALEKEYLERLLELR